MSIELSSMTVLELEQLLRQVQAEICRRRRFEPPPRVALARFAAGIREQVQ
ncbi:MAG: hypothetical protein WCZ28_06065 [Burkholderiaceae bacterium]